MKPVLAVVANIQIAAFNTLATIAEKRKSCVVSAYRLWLFLIIIPSITTATTVITIVGPGLCILVGSDSLFSYHGGGQNMRCKIQHEGMVFFATAGLREKPETSFNSIQIARESYKRVKTNVPKVADDFLSQVEKPLREALKYSRSHDPNYYRSHYLGKPILENTFAGFSGSNPQVEAVSFSLDQAGNLIHAQAQLPNAFGNDTVFSGEH